MRTPNKEHGTGAHHSVLRAPYQQRQGAGARNTFEHEREREATPPAAVGFARRHHPYPTQESVSAPTTMYVPSPGVALLPALQRRPALGAGDGEREGETSEAGPQGKRMRGEHGRAGVAIATSAVYAAYKQRKALIPTKRKDPAVSLAPLLSDGKRRLDQQAAVAAEEQARVTDAMAAAMERMEGRIPLSFLLQRRHTALAERVALRAMCAALRRHHSRVRRVCFGKWLQRAVTLRVLGQIARQEALTRHAALAHACAVVQHKVQLRLLRDFHVWQQATMLLRLVEHTKCACVLQRSWRRYSLVTRFQSLALAYRSRHRDQAARRIQARARIFLAKAVWRELVAQRLRFDAARRVQSSYRNYVVRRIAWKRRRVLASVDVQRSWRGFRGRQAARRRRKGCHQAAKAVFESQWLPQALLHAIGKQRAAETLQRWSRVQRFRYQVSRSSAVAYRRRRFVPAWRIQQAWRRCRLDRVRASLFTVADRVVVLYENAARLVQHSFRIYMARKKAVSARRLVMLLRHFQAKRGMAHQQLQWIQRWTRTFLTRWVAAIRACNPSSAWLDPLLALYRRIEDAKSDQRSPLRRLQVNSIFKLMREIREVHRTFEHQHATQIQCKWRWHRLLVLVDTMRRATLLLQRAIPPLVRLFALRRRQRRVLTRWKRGRLLCMRSAFGRWKTEHALLMHTHDLERADAKIRKTKWFRHLKLRKRVFRSWRDFIRRRQHKRRRLSSVQAWHETRLVGRAWRVWTQQAVPVIVVENLLREQVWLLHAWQALERHRADGLKRKLALAWRHGRVTQRIWDAWRSDLEECRAATAAATRIGGRNLRKRALAAWYKHACGMKRADVFQRHHASSNGIRQWVLHVCLARQSAEWKSSCERFNSRRIARAHWIRWRLYVAQRRARRRLLLRMDEHHAGVLKRQGIRQWLAFVPILRDLRVTTAMAADFSAFRIKRLVFSAGFRAFWARTAGARRIAMATSIQRAFRAKRARQKLFVLRAKIRSQIDTRVTSGADVVLMSGEQLMARLGASKRGARELWVFALLSFPWRPISQSMRDVFSRVATNWAFLRKQRMGFALVSANDTVKRSLRVGRGGTEEFQHAQEGYYSLTSVFGLEASRLPCIVGFWLGNGRGIVDAPVVAITDGGVPILQRRYERVCGAHRRDSLVLSLADGQGGSRDCGVAELMRWMEARLDDSRVASATDLQAYARGFLARRHAKRLRVAHETNRAAARIQRWRRGVRTRLLFWERLAAELHSCHSNARRIQTQYRRYILLQRVHDAVERQRASPMLFPHAPLCGACLGGAVGIKDGDAASLDAVDASARTLARVACRECCQALCESCAATLHSAGTRAQHVLHVVDARAMNDRVCILCAVCEVAKCVRACQTCAQDAEQPGKASNDPVRTCRACFERVHCPPPAQTAQLSTDPHPSQQSRWWQADAFRRHQWRVVLCDSALSTPSPTSALTSAMVVDKYGWSTLDSLERARKEREAAAQSRQQRSDQLLAIRAQHEAALRDAFDRYDADKSGAIGRDELRRMLREELCQPLSEAQVDRAMRAMDRSGNGQVEFGELLAWFAEDVLDNDAPSDSGASLALLKEALKAKRLVRRYKERLRSALQSSPLGVFAKKRRRDALEGEEDAQPPTKAKVPGFPSVECLELADFAAKRRVFSRFMRGNYGGEWVFEDEAAAFPTADVADVFASVFVPRWNAGELTHDFYLDGEAFDAEGERWERRWDATSRQFAFHTRRKRVHAPGGGSSGHMSTRKALTGRRRASNATTDSSNAQEGALSVDASASRLVEQWEDVVERIDPRRRPQLLDEAKQAFALADRDASGSIDARKFRRLVSAELCEPLSSAQARRTFEAIDADGSGTIDFDEFFQWYAALKSQDAPATRQEERARTLLKTKHRAKRAVEAVAESAGMGAHAVKEAVERTRWEQQLARERKRGASPELLRLLTERHAKPLAQKALSLHANDVERARAWLEERRGEQEQEAAANAAAGRALQLRRREAQLRRRDTIAAVRAKLLAALPAGRAKKKRQAHAARLQTAVANLDREIQQMERQATIRHARGQQF